MKTQEIKLEKHLKMFAQLLNKCKMQNAKRKINGEVTLAVFVIYLI